jgi:excisionase family DNA binding protein
MVAKALAEAHPPSIQVSVVARPSPRRTFGDCADRTVEGGNTMSLLSVEEAAERLGTSPRFIRRLIAERRIAFTKLGRHVRIDTKDIDAFIAAGRVEPLQSSEVS